MRGIDLVRLGLDGHRWGIGLPSRRRRRRVEEAIASVGAAGFARFPIGNLSGGEQQRLRVAQALVGNPQLLLCDEPLLSLDLKHQREVVELINDQRRASAISVLFVTHEINPIMSAVDRVLYLVGTRWAVGTPVEIFTSARLSELYQTDVEVLEVGGRIVVVGAPDSAHAEAGSSHYHHAWGRKPSFDDAVRLPVGNLRPQRADRGHPGGDHGRADRAAGHHPRPRVRRTRGGRVGVHRRSGRPRRGQRSGAGRLARIDRGRHRDRTAGEPGTRTEFRDWSDTGVRTRRRGLSAVAL